MRISAANPNRAQAALGNGKWSHWLPIAEAQQLESEALWGATTRAIQSGQAKNVILPLRVAVEMGLVGVQ